MALTPDTLLLRKVSDVSNSTVLFYRYFFFAICVFFVFIVENYKSKEIISKIYGLGKIGIFAGLVNAITNILFTIAIQNTAVANVLIINATSPLLTSVLSRIILKEDIEWRTIVCFLVCFGAILIVFIGDAGSGGGSMQNDLTGIICAVFSALTLGLYFVILRMAAKAEAAPNCTGSSKPDMMFNNVIAGFAVAIIALIMGAEPANINGVEAIYLLLQGVVGLPIGFILLMKGPALISAAEVSLWMLVETILGPIWVWLGGYEAPPPYTIYGGVILISSLVVHSVVSLRDNGNTRTELKQQEDAYIRDIQDLEEDSLEEANEASDASEDVSFRQQQQEMVPVSI